MKFALNSAAVAVLVASMVASPIYAEAPKPPVKKAVATKKAKTPPPPSVAEQIQALKTELEGQINGLKSDLAAKDAQLKQAQEAAAAAQAAADRAQAAASQETQAVTENAAAVSTLQGTVTDLKANSLSLATTVSDETSKIKKEMGAPSTLHYKGITLSPGGYVAAETVYRTKATGGDIPTAFSAIPYESGDGYKLSEFFGSARQSRLTLQADGKTSWGSLRGYYEADFLGTGITSNNNQSNSYVLRQRILYAQAQTNSGLTFVGGQLWSLATEQKKGITSAPGDVATPQTIDPNYVTGFVWTRQYGFRVVKSFKNAAFGVSLENPQILYSASLAGNTPYAVIGSAGANGGNYNAAVSASVPTTYIQNYGSQKENTSTAGYTYTSIPIYNTIYANTNIANLSFNQAPDVVAKLAVDPGFGHYEVFGIAGFLHETVYPGTTTNSVKYGNQADIEGFNGGTPGGKFAASTPAGNYVNSIMVGGFGASARLPIIADKLSIGAKGLYGPGIGRYGNSTLSDVTSDAKGNFAPIHGLSGLLTIEANPNPRLMIYLNYGGDYAGRTDFGTGSTIASTLGSPTATFCETGTTAANASTNCSTAPSAAMIAAGGSWGGHWSVPSVGATAVGYGSRLLSNSACTSLATPGYSGSSTGYYPGGSCGAQTRNVQEITGGYWYDIYKGDKGRLRQGVQYGYAVREGWSGAGTPGIGAKGIDNMFWTTFRYYLP